MRWLLSKTATEGVLPWLTLVLGVLGVGWTLIAFSAQNDIQRAQTILAIHRQYLEMFPSGTDDILGLSAAARSDAIQQIRCRVFSDAAAEGTLTTTEVLPECSTVRAVDKPLIDRIGAAQTEAMKAAIRTAISDIAPIDRTGAERMLTFFLSVRLCATENQCDADIATALFAKDMTAFLNQTCALTTAHDDYRRQAEMLATFVRDQVGNGPVPWATDPRRENLFSCDPLRPIGAITLP
jgi:hypothetical protein